MKKVRYIGAFPPPFGGVSIKNNLIYDELSKSVQIERYHCTNRLAKQIKDIVDILFKRGTFIIGVSASRGKSTLLSRLFYYFNRNSMKKTIYFMMGGLEAGRIASDNQLIKIYSNYACVYVETETMKNRLTSRGMDNVKVFPNCRKRPNKEYVPRVNISERLKCVFFSNIQRIKGVETVIEVAKEMPEVDFYFYGSIEEEIKEYFELQCDVINNCVYMGVFDATTRSVYDELNKYDILLFPTRWRNEGVPGVLVEGKIVGLAEIVSNVCYNAELVENEVEGIVLEENDSQSLKKAVERLNVDRELLFQLKQGSKKSAERFYIDNYKDDLLKYLEEK